MGQFKHWVEERDFVGEGVFNWLGKQFNKAKQVTTDIGTAASHLPFSPEHRAKNFPRLPLKDKPDPWAQLAQGNWSWDKLKSGPPVEQDDEPRPLPRREPEELPEEEEELTEEEERAKTWLEQFRIVAEQGEEALKAMMGKGDLLKQFTREEEGDPIVLLFKRLFGGSCYTVKKLLIDVLHLPKIIKFFFIDTPVTLIDLVKNLGKTAFHPTSAESWKLLAVSIADVLRLPIGATMAGVTLKFSYQQYQLINKLGLPEISLVNVVGANLILSYLLFVCFLIPIWFKEAEHPVWRTIAKVMKAMFPSRMYDKEEEHKEGFREWMNNKLISARK